MLRNWREKLRIIYLDEKKRQQKEKNESEKNNTKTEKPKSVGPFLVQKQNFDFFVHNHVPEQNYPKKRCKSCHVANAFLCRLELQ